MKEESSYIATDPPPPQAHPGPLEQKEQQNVSLEEQAEVPFPSPVHESKSESEVAQLCLTLSDPMDFSLPGSSVHICNQGRWANSSYISLYFKKKSLEY